jgi:hypothetical protein
MNPKMAYVLAMSLAGGYDGADGGDVDRGDGGVVSCWRRALPHLLQKAASSSSNAPHFGQLGMVSPSPLRMLPFFYTFLLLKLTFSRTP